MIVRERDRYVCMSTHRGRAAGGWGAARRAAAGGSRSGPAPPATPATLATPATAATTSPTPRCSRSDDVVFLDILISL